MDYKTARKKSSSGLPQRSRSASSKRTHTPNQRKSSTSSAPMDKTSMLVMEANEISTLLQKDYVSTDFFCMEIESCFHMIAVRSYFLRMCFGGKN